jgi:L-malate glycosyltransferase
MPSASDVHPPIAPRAMSSTRRVAPGISARPRPGAARPRIALVAPTLEILGGQGIQASVLDRHLRFHGYAVDTVPINPRFPPGLRWARRLPYARTLLNETLYGPSLARLRHADIIHVFSASYWSFLLAPTPALVAGRLLARPTVLHYHSGEADDHLSHWGPLVHPWLRLADRIVVPSEYLRLVFARHGYHAEVIPNVVEPAAFRYRERRRLRPRLLSVRNLERHYRVDNTLRAFARLQAARPDATLTVAGYGSEESNLRELVGRLGAGGVRFVGRVEPADLPDLYDEADLFVNSSAIDNQPVSILEAFSAGLPVVSTAPGDVRAMLRDGEAGVMVPDDDPAAMASAIERLLDDGDRALRLARRARWEVKRYTWPHVGDQWDRLYADLTTPAPAAAVERDACIPSRQADHV